MVKRISARPAVKPMREAPVINPMPKAPVMERKLAVRKIALPVVQMPRTVAAPIMQTPQPARAPIGTVSHFYSHLNVAIIALTDTLRVGETIRIKGHTTELTQHVESMQNEHLQVSEGHAGQHIGVKVQEKVRQGDVVYKG